MNVPKKEVRARKQNHCHPLKGIEHNGIEHNSRLTFTSVISFTFFPIPLNAKVWARKYNLKI